jgi:hypothetical protein
VDTPEEKLRTVLTELVTPDELRLGDHLVDSITLGDPSPEDPEWWTDPSTAVSTSGLME